MQVVNPTSKWLNVVVAFFDDGEHCLKCQKSEKPLSPNDMWEIDVPIFEKKKFGVVKIISLDAESNEILPGLIGYKRHFLAVGDAKDTMGIAFSESPLVAIPMEYAEGELEIIRERCGC